MSDDLANLGIQVDSTQAATAAGTLDQLAASGAKAEASVGALGVTGAASAAEMSNYSQKILDALQAQYGMSEAQAAATAGIKLQTTAVVELSQAQKDLAANTLAAAVEANAIAKAQDAAFNQAYIEASAFNKAMDDAARASEAGTGVITANSRAVRESISATRYALEGNFTRAAGSATVLAQALGIVNLAFTAEGAILIGVIATFIAATVASIQYEAAQEKLLATTIGLGAASGLTTAQITDASNKAAAASGVSGSAAEASAEAFADAGIKSVGTLETLSASVNTYAQLTGEKAKQAQTDLAKAMQDPVKGATDLNDKLQILDATQIQQIDTLSAYGDKMAAQAIITDALTKRTDEAHAAGVGLGGTFQTLTTDLQNFWTWLGKTNDQLHTFALLELQLGLYKPQVDPTKAGAAANQAARDAALNSASSAAVPYEADTPEGKQKAQLDSLAEAQFKLQSAVNADSQPGGDKANLAQATAALQEYTRAHDTLTDVITKYGTVAHGISEAEQKLATDRHNHASQAIIDADTVAKVQIQNAGKVMSEAQAAQEAKDAGALAGDKVRTPKAHTTAAESFATGTTKVDTQASGDIDAANAYLASDAAGEKATATAKAHADAVTADAKAVHQHTSEVDVNARAQADLNEAAAKVVLNTDKSTSTLEQNTVAQRVANEAVEAGTSNVAQAQQAMQDDIKLRPLQTQLLLTTGKAHDAVTAAIQHESDALKDNHWTDYVQSLNASNEGITNQIALLQLRMGAINDNSRANAVLIAQETERQKLTSGPEGDRAANSSEGKQAIQQAGNLAGAQYDLSNSKLPFTSMAEQVTQLANAQKALNEAQAQGVISAGQYAVASNQLLQTQLNLKVAQTGSWTDAAIAGLHSLTDTGKTVAQQMQQNFTQVFTTLEDGFAKSIGSAITSSKNLGEALREVAESAVQELITSLVKLEEQELIAHLFGSGSGGAGGLLSLLGSVFGGAGGASSGASLGGSLASAGAAAMAGGGHISGPGTGTSDSIPIYASHGEFMVNAEATAKHGPLLEAINSNRPIQGFAAGGPIGQALANSNGGHSIYMDFSGANFGGVDADTIEQRFRKSMETEYGPAIVQTSVKQANLISQHQNKRQMLNGKR